MAGVQESFSEVTKEDLIAKLLTKEYNSIYKRNSISDLNDRRKSNDRDDRPRRERGKRNSRGSEEGMKTFFINLGLKDDINKGALLGYVCDVTGISGAQVGRIVMDKTHSYMDVSEDIAAQLLTLDGKQRNGHDLRVNEHKGAVKEPARERGGRGGGGFKGRRSGNDSGGGFKGRSNSGGSGHRRRRSDSNGGSNNRSDRRRDKSSSDNNDKGSKRGGFKGRKW